jgi:hypothetical protein
MSDAEIEHHSHKQTVLYFPNLGKEALYLK